MAFDAPFGFIFGARGDTRVSPAAARRKRVLGLTTEPGGPGTVTPEILVLSERGIQRLLHHIGVLPRHRPDAASGMRLMELTNIDYFVYAPDEGLFEPYLDLLAEVRKGEATGVIHHPETSWMAPTICYFEHDGLVICQRIPARVERGDCLFHLAADIET